MTDSQLGVLGLATSLPGLLDVCIRLGDFLVGRLKAYQGASKSIIEYGLKMSVHLDNQKDAFRLISHFDPLLPADIKERLVQLLRQLRNILFEANEVLAKYEPASSISPANHILYALQHEKSLSSLTIEIAGWEELFLKRLVFLQLCQQIPAAGNIRQSLHATVPSLQPRRIQLERPLEQTQDNFPSHHQSPLDVRKGLDCEDIFVSQFYSSVLIEHHEYEGSPQPELDIKLLAKMLHSASPMLMHILHCQGYFARKEIRSPRIELYFTIPSSLQSMTPRSLRSILLDPKNAEQEPQHALNDRLTLANHLTTAVWYVHSGNFVHKAIRPETIIVFLHTKPKPKYDCFPYALGPAFLAGFNRFRSEGAKNLSTHREDGIPQRNLYRHPERWNETDAKGFSMLHDIYSLGVVLLEVGLWRSLLEAFDQKAGRWVYSGGLDEQMKEGNGLSVKEWIVKVAKTELPKVMGKEYSRVVVTCLTCVEGDMTVVSKSDSSNNPTSNGVAYVEAVMERLERIHI